MLECLNKTPKCCSPFKLIMQKIEHLAVCYIIGDRHKNKQIENRRQNWNTHASG